jgi:glycosyltransferase involved in cell wall biosynthesis
VTLRIALVHPHSWPDVRRGGERYLDDLAWYLARHDHHVTVITAGTGPLSEHVGDHGVMVRSHRSRGGGRLRRWGMTADEAFFPSALADLRRHRFDLVHALVPAAGLAARLTRHRTVYTVIGHPTRAELADRPVASRIFRAAVRSATVAAALSHASAANVAELFGRQPEVLPPGTRIESFPPDLEPRSGPPRLLFSAHNEDRRKGLDVLMGAMPAVLDRHPEARLRLSGAGDPSWALATLGADHDRVRAAVEVMGAGDLADVPGRYRAATVTVLPARDEAFGLALVESLASGTPVVCSDDGGMPEIVNDPAIGRTVPLGDGRALAAAIDETIALAALDATPPACAARARAFSWDDAVGPRHEAVYEEALRR